MIGSSFEREDDKNICDGNASSRLATTTRRTFHQQQIFASGRNGCVGVDTLRQSSQRHPGGGILCARRQFNTSDSISPSDRCFNVSSRSVGLLF
jgi:hypothetical protein